MSNSQQETLEEKREILRKKREELLRKETNFQGFFYSFLKKIL